MPCPAIETDVAEVALRFPAESLKSQDGIGDGDGRISVAAGHHFKGHVAATSLFKGMHHLQHGGPLATAEIDREQLRRFGEQAVEGSAVTFRKVHHVDVITDAGAIAGGPVAPEHLQLFAPPHGDLTDKREEVVWCAQRVFTNFTAGMGAHRVEVAQTGNAPLIRSACGKVVQHLFNRCFGVAVGVDRLNRRCLWDRHALGISVERGTAAEHQRAAVTGVHCSQQRPCAVQIDVPVAQRFAYGFTNGFQTCEVNDCLNRLACRACSFEQLLENVLITDVAVDELQSLSVAFLRGVQPCQHCNFFNSERGAVAVVVQHDQVMTCIEQHKTGVAADESCSSSDQ